MCHAASCAHGHRLLASWRHPGYDWTRSGAELRPRPACATRHSGNPGTQAATAPVAASTHHSGATTARGLHVPHAASGRPGTCGGVPRREYATHVRHTRWGHPRTTDHALRLQGKQGAQQARASPGGEGERDVGLPRPGRCRTRQVLQNRRSHGWNPSPGREGGRDVGLTEPGGARAVEPAVPRVELQQLLLFLDLKLRFLEIGR